MGLYPIVFTRPVCSGRVRPHTDQTSIVPLPTATERREFLATCAALGIGGTLLPGVLWAKVSAGAEITVETIAAAEELAGVSFDTTKRAMLLAGLKAQAKQIETLHAIVLDNATAPAIIFNPEPPAATPMIARAGPATAAPRPAAMVRSKIMPRAVPARLEDLAFWPVSELSELIRTKKVTSVQLTEMYIGRIKKFDPQLLCVITLLEERAMASARAADGEIARGKYRGPLHGIPWGAKDLLAVKGAPTTWGTPPFKTQVIDADATVVQRLDAAGAVLVAKLTLGELAQGDRWFGGMTRNPWKPDQGSSGSSAGPGSAVASGLVAFAVGSETLGSISSPSTRNGVTGLRPTFGRVPRTGAMALSWTMDKLGPMARSVEDCAFVLDAIHGPDRVDLSVHDRPYQWDATLDVKKLRIGFMEAAFNQERPTRKFDDDALAAIRGLGVTLIPVTLPPAEYGAMRMILTAEAAAAFDALTRSGRDSELVQQDANAWPNTFRVARFVPAVDYINANRVRSMAIASWATLFETVDCIVAPTNSGQLIATNLTGHPAVILPNGFRDDGTPVSITFLGGLYEEGKLLALASGYQRATDWHTRTPAAFK